MPTATYDLIASNVLTTNASSVTFSSIPATYRDLVLVVTPTSTDLCDLIMRFNSATTNYVGVFMRGNGSTAQSSTSPTNLINASAAYSDTTVKSVWIFQIMDYAQTDKHKTVLVRSNFSGGQVAAAAHRWADTSAINSISLAADSSQSWSTGASFHLYGIVS